MWVVLLQLFWIPAPFKDIGRCIFKKSPFLKLTLYFLKSKVVNSQFYWVSQKNCPFAVIFNNLWLLKVNLGWGSFEIKKCCEIVKSAEIERTIYSESKSKKFLSLNLLEKSELDINRHCTLGYHCTKGYQCLEGNHCTMGNNQTKMLS